MYRLLPLLFIAVYSIAITPVEVTELTLKVGVGQTEELYYGFAEGDQIAFDFEEVNGKDLTEIEIIELPTNSKFMEFKASKIEGKIITVNKKSVYKFRFTNKTLSKKVCRVSIKRIPASEDLIDFNTDWKFETVYDTTYIPYTEDSLIGYDTLKFKETLKEVVKTETFDEMIMDKTQRVHSLYNGNSNKTYLRFDLPVNKVEDYKEEKVKAWAYWIGVGNEASEAYGKNIKAMGELAAGVASVYGTPLAGIAVGAITELLTPKTGEDVAYRFMDGFENVQAFLAGNEYYLFDQGKGIAAYGKNSNLLQGSYYIGLYNDNEVTGIDVNVKIVVIKEIKTFADVTYDREKVTPRYVTLNKRRMQINTSQIRVNAN